MVYRARHKSGRTQQDQACNWPIRRQLFTTVKRRKLNGMTMSRDLLVSQRLTILQGTMNGGRKRGGHRKRWKDNIKEWTGLSIVEGIQQSDKMR